MIEDPALLTDAPLEDEAYSYAMLVEDGKIAVKAIDTGRWLLGEYVRQLETYYAERTIKQYADDIQYSHQSLYEFAGMVTFYPGDVREKIAAMGLTYSHMREARKLRTLERAVEFLELAALNYWTVDHMRIMLRTLRKSGQLDIAETYTDVPPALNLRDIPIPPPPRNLWQGIASIKVSKQGIMLEGVALPDYIDPTKKYEVIFREVIDE